LVAYGILILFIILKLKKDGYMKRRIVKIRITRLIYMQLWIFKVHT
jgi:hypothetical protein